MECVTAGDFWNRFYHNALLLIQVFVWRFYVLGKVLTIRFEVPNVSSICKFGFAGHRDVASCIRR